MARNDIKNSSLLKTKFLIYAFNGRTANRALFVKYNYLFMGVCLAVEQIIYHRV